MNDWFKHLVKIEFAITMACTGRCRHCQNGDVRDPSSHIDADLAVEAIRSLCAHYPIRTVMTFGGEPLLYPDVVCAIHKTASELGVAHRQIITNGYFTLHKERIEAVVRALAESGVNDLLLSVDAFHQENIPLEPVLHFGKNAVNAGIPICISPAWLVSREDKNHYNLRTKEPLGAFAPMGIPVASGNVVFPMGNALKYLREYFDENVSEASPYFEDPSDIRTISIDPDGGVLKGSLRRQDILEILNEYRP